MSTITLLNNEITIEKEYEMAVCVWETTGQNLTNFQDVPIKLGQKVFDIKILESGSIIFKQEPDSEGYIITMFPQMFGFPTDEQMIEVKNLEETISKSQDRINEIYESIQRTGYTDIN